MENFGVEFLMSASMAGMHVVISKTVDDGWLLFVQRTFPCGEEKKQIKVEEAEASAISALLIGETLPEDTLLSLYEIAQPVMERLGSDNLRCIP